MSEIIGYALGGVFAPFLVWTFFWIGSMQADDPARDINAAMESGHLRDHP